jgi:soluble P-type ATPase
MFFEGNSAKDLRIKYKTSREDNETNHKKNIYISRVFLEKHYKVMIVIGNGCNCDGCEGIYIGAK